MMWCSEGGRCEEGGEYERLLEEQHGESEEDVDGGIQATRVVSTGSDDVVCVCRMKNSEDQRGTKTEILSRIVRQLL